MTPHYLHTGDSINKHGKEEKNLGCMSQFLGNMEVQVFIQKSVCYSQDS